MQTLRDNLAWSPWTVIDVSEASAAAAIRIASRPLSAVFLEPPCSPMPLTLDLRGSIRCHGCQSSFTFQVTIEGGLFVKGKIGPCPECGNSMRAGAEREVFRDRHVVLFYVAAGTSLLGQAIMPIELRIDSATSDAVKITPAEAAVAAPTAPLDVGHLPRAIVNQIGMPLTLIPPGEFLMGSPTAETDPFHQRSIQEGPVRRVRITRPFYMGVYPVTQTEYQAVNGENPSWFAATGRGAGVVRGLDTRRFPVDSVSWEEAVEFCRRVGDLTEEKKAGRVYRLPTEAEWEYACRAGTTTPFSFGASLSSMQANFDGSRSPTRTWGGARAGPFLERTCSVGCYPPNGFGLFDMHGNVAEWCSDFHDKDYYTYGQTDDPQGPAQGDWHVVRGGDWRCTAGYLRSARRDSWCPRNHVHFKDRASMLGFRVVVTLVD